MKETETETETEIEMEIETEAERINEGKFYLLYVNLENCYKLESEIKHGRVKDRYRILQILNLSYSARSYNGIKLHKSILYWVR